jgi:hypothetical protein
LNNVLTIERMFDMVRHWLNTPPNGYLGSGYGCDLKQLLQNPMSSAIADSFIAKLREDVPAVGALGEGMVNIYVDDTQGVVSETRIIYLEIAGQMLAVN